MKKSEKKRAHTHKTKTFDQFHECFSKLRRRRRIKKMVFWIVMDSNYPRKLLLKNYASDRDDAFERMEFFIKLWKQIDRSQLKKVASGKEKEQSHTKKKDIKCEYKTGKLANDVCAHSNFQRKKKNSIWFLYTRSVI